MSQIFVKSYEEECGNDFLIVSCDSKTNEEILKCCEIASLYANYFDDYEPIDEHFDKMLLLRDSLNGFDRFFTYLSDYCGCTVGYLDFDFCFEW